jgi:hypothetical protein
MARLKSYISISFLFKKNMATRLIYSSQVIEVPFKGLFEIFLHSSTNNLIEKLN